MLKRLIRFLLDKDAARDLRRLKELLATGMPKEMEAAYEKWVASHESNRSTEKFVAQIKELMDGEIIKIRTMEIASAAKADTQ